MRRSDRMRRPVSLVPNLTPLIDVVFLLLVFFMFVTQLAKDRAVRLTLPTLPDREVERFRGRSTLIVNVVPVGSSEPGAGGYRFGMSSFPADADGLRALSGALGEARRRDPGAALLLRAQADERYERVHPVMQAAVLAGFPGVQLVTIPAGRAGRPGVMP